ncbi:MAG: hypothetical protein LR008_01765 [Candidatus Pacebacteria bacterium]|nr:hypothetical protein [Candidatus Paceibacterota bacterium]
MKYVTILGIIALLIAVFIYQLIFSDSTNKSAVQTESELSGQIEYLSTDLAETQDRTGNSTLDDIRGWGEDLECTIRVSADEVSEEVEGTYFVSDGKMRGDFLTSSPDLEGKILSSLIVKDSTMYTWSEIEGELYGVKMDLSLMDDSSIETNQVVSLDDDVKYSCKSWNTVDQTVFNPPVDILFQDLGELLQSGMEYGNIYEEGELPF